MGTGHFRHIQFIDLQKIEDDDLKSISTLVLQALQDLFKNLLLDKDGATRDGFFGDGFKVVPNSGEWGLKVTPGIGFQYDETDQGDEDSAYRAVVLREEVEIDFNSAPSEPDDDTYYVHVKWNSANANLQSRLVRPDDVSAFEADDVYLHEDSSPIFVIDTNSSKVGYQTIASVLKEADDSESDDYVITDLRELFSENIGLFDAAGNKAELGPTVLESKGALQDFLVRATGDLYLRGFVEAALHHLSGFTRGLYGVSTQQLKETIPSAGGSFKMREATVGNAPSKVIDFFTREAVDLGGGDVATIVSLLGTCPANGDDLGDDLVIFRLGCEDEGIDFRLAANPSSGVDLVIHKSCAPADYDWETHGLIRITSEGHVWMNSHDLTVDVPIFGFAPTNAVTADRLKANDFYPTNGYWAIAGLDLTDGPAYLFGEIPLRSELSVIGGYRNSKPLVLTVYAASSDEASGNGVLTVTAWKRSTSGSKSTVGAPVTFDPGDSGSKSIDLSATSFGTGDRLYVECKAEGGHDSSTIMIYAMEVGYLAYSVLS